MTDWKISKSSVAIIDEKGKQVIGILIEQDDDVVKLGIPKAVPPEIAYQCWLADVSLHQCTVCDVIDDFLLGYNPAACSRACAHALVVVYLSRPLSKTRQR